MQKVDTRKRFFASEDEEVSDSTLRWAVALTLLILALGVAFVVYSVHPKIDSEAMSTKIEDIQKDSNDLWGGGSYQQAPAPSQSSTPAEGWNSSTNGPADNAVQ